MSAPFLWVYLFFSAGIIAGTCIAAPLWSLIAAAACAGLVLRSHSFRLAFAVQALFLCLLGQQICSRYVTQYESNPLRRWVAAHEGEMAPVAGLLRKLRTITSSF
jgi:hypothetical protein